MFENENVETQSVTGTSDSTPTQETDWKSKFAGQTRKVTSLTNKLAELEAQLAEKEEALAEAKSQLSTVKRGATTTTKTVQEELAAATAKAAQLEQKLKDIEMATSARRLVETEFPVLKELFEDGDIKDRSTFADDDAYKTYLAKLAAKFGAPAQQNEPAQQEAISQQKPPNRDGFVPSAPATARPVGDTHNKSVLEAELDRLDVRIPKEAQRIQEIYTILSNMD